MTKNVDDIYVLKSRVSDSNLQRDNYSDLPTPGKKYAIYDLQIFVVIYFLININGSVACINDDIVLNYNSIFLYINNIDGNMTRHSPSLSGDVITSLIAEGSKINSCRNMSL